MWTILKKELTSSFGSLTAYLVACVFVLVTALFLWFFDNEYNIFNLGEASLTTFFFIAPWVFLLLIPALTMRQLAEEKQMGTLAWMFTQPIQMAWVVLGKYMAVLVLILFMLLTTVFYINTLSHFSLNQAVDGGTIFSGYIGLFLLGSTFAAVGMGISALTSNQVVAYVITVVCCFILYYGFQGLASYNLLGPVDYYMQQLGAAYHYNTFLKGILDTRDILYFVVISGLGLLTAHVSIQKLSAL